MPFTYASFHSGCLLADAHDVSLTTRRLHQIEDRCIPWHYLIERSAFVYEKQEFINALHDGLAIRSYAAFSFLPMLREADEAERARRRGWNAPTIDDLNEDTGREFDRLGVAETTDEDQARLDTTTGAGREVARQDWERLRERGVSRMMVIDVRNDSDEEVREERPGRR